MIRGVECDEVADQRPGVRPEAKRPAWEHPALAVAEHVHHAARGAGHRPERVHHVLARGLDVAHRVEGQRDGTVRPVQRPEGALVVPGVVRVGIEVRARHEQDRVPRRAAHAGRAAERGAQGALRDGERRTAAVERRVRPGVGERRTPAHKQREHRCRTRERHPPPTNHHVLQFRSQSGERP